MSHLKTIKEDERSEEIFSSSLTTTAAADTVGTGGFLSAEESSSIRNNNKNNNQVWFQEEERWELTWPIWHMLPRHERKSLALKHGFKTIGEFEEFMSLQREITDSTEEVSSSRSTMATTSSSVQQPYRMDYPFAPAAAAQSQRPNQQQKLKSSNGGDDDDDEFQDEKADDDSLAEETLQQRLDTEEEAATEKTSSTEELVKKGGTILMLPDELLHRVFDWLPVDTYATLALVSPHWKQFTRTEAVYKRLCERLYLNQSKRRALHVGRFENSYRVMLERRPRVRAGGGVYVMKYTKLKPIQRDMWTEVRFYFHQFRFSSILSFFSVALFF
jgi:F-box protein 9